MDVYGLFHSYFQYIGTLFALILMALCLRFFKDRLFKENVVKQ